MIPIYVNGVDASGPGQGLNPVFSSDIKIVKGSPPLISLRNEAGQPQARAFVIRLGSDGSLEFRGQNDDGTLNSGISVGRNGSITVPILVIQSVIRLGEISYDPDMDKQVGDLVNFDDAKVYASGASVTEGGGTNHVLCRWNGTAWKVVA